MDLSDRLARFAPVSLAADRDPLSERQQAMVLRLIDAGRELHTLYLRQIWPGSPQMRADLAASRDPDDRLRLRLFDLMCGPWDRFEQDRPFMGTRPRPLEGDFYPQGFDQKEMDAWLEEHPADAEAFTGFFSVIRRQDDALLAVPFHQVYKAELEPAAEALHEAAALAEYSPLAEYLKLRAQALLSDEYFDSDCAWVGLQDGPLEVVFGPYEVYEDRLFGYKAAYEAMVGIRDLEESARFQELVEHLPTMAAQLPVAKAYQGEVFGLASPIVVADTVYNAGMLSRVAIPTAFVLPNDRRVRTTVGTKKVMIRNVYQAKFDKIVYPIAERLLDPEQVAALSFESSFAHVLLHEISHALGAQMIPGPDGDLQPVHKPLRELFTTIEECKADIVGLYNVLFLADQGVFPREWSEIAPVAYLASIFRLTRLGVGRAHSRGNLLALNFLREAGAVRRDSATGRFRAEAGAMAQAVEELTRILLIIEGDGDYEGARALVERYAQVTDEASEAWGQLDDVYMDLAPTYPWVDAS
jgi:hypothetical protein